VVHNLSHLLLCQFILPQIDNRSISLHKCRSSCSSTRCPIAQVRERSTCMDLIRVNVVALSALSKLCGHKGCDAGALDILPDCVETVIWGDQLVLILDKNGSYLPTCGISLCEVPL
jgi:hypothetical protein